MDSLDDQRATREWAGVCLCVGQKTWECEKNRSRVRRQGDVGCCFGTVECFWVSGVNTGHMMGSHTSDHRQQTRTDTLSVLGSLLKTIKVFHRPEWSFLSDRLYHTQDLILEWWWNEGQWINPLWNTTNHKSKCTCFGVSTFQVTMLLLLSKIAWRIPDHVISLCDISFFR